jgi:acetoin utilization deacetylase AcuC-like enzyme
MLASSRLPVCVVQEGGYALDSLAACGYAFASGVLGSPEAGALGPAVADHVGTETASPALVGVRAGAAENRGGVR